MAGKGSKKARRPRNRKPNLQVWANNDRLELLAYLNWCVQYEVDFEATVMGHLKSVTAKDFSSRQIRDKLRREWNNFGTCDDFEDLYLQGTAALNPGEAEDQVIQQMFARLGTPPRSRYLLRRASSVPKSRSRTLSAVRGTPKASTLKASGPSGPSDFDDELGDTYERKTRSTVINNLDEYELGSSPPADKDGEPDRDPGTIPDSECSELVELAYTPDPSPQRLDKELDCTTEAQMLDELEALRTELLKEKACVFTLRSRLSETQREMDELHNSQATNTGQYNFQQQIAYLLGQLEAKDRLWQDTVAFRADSLTFSREAIKVEYDLLYHGINEASSFICEMSPHEEGSPQHNSQCQQSAQTWAVKASGWKLERLLSYSHKERILKEKLFASLATAGVFELIFEPVFPDILALESPILHQYRKHIQTKDGRQALHELDLMALKSLTSEEHFTAEVLPERAKSLAEFVMRALEFFFPLENQDVDRRHQKRLSRADSLETVLTQALGLKLHIALSKGRFQFHFFKPGDPFDAKCMTRDTSCTAGSSSGRKSRQDRVKLCLLPALYFLSEEEEEHVKEAKYLEMHMDNVRVNRLAEARQEDLKLLNLVAKGVVLT
ncbi:hypothetical protein FALBO_10855 [Fusarium albosuccineum]|uniref:Uncharacterized protein n=1 Tax=Fusarium albosuccineum TaxID=1237068 RepID=A0A8H4L3D4_9HYPO|nr:hypothetical protein FALBO_10855 [Fusarium albosuccineum]